MPRTKPRVSFLRKIKIRWRLIISFLILSLVPLIVVGIISFSSAHSILASVIKHYTAQVINQFGAVHGKHFKCF